jgi:hypothetical protein
MPRGKQPNEREGTPDGTASTSSDSVQGDRDEVQIVSEPSPLLDAGVQEQLGRQLTAYYTELVNQPVPEAFLELLKKLDRSENGK